MFLIACMSTLIMLLLYHSLYNIVNCLKIFFMDFFYFIGVFLSIIVEIFKK